MTRLTLNDIPVVIKAGSSFRLTQTNPFLTDAGSFTLDVTLPLKGCAQNQKVFGALHRPEMSLAHLVGSRYAMRLLAPPVDMEGYATVTAVDDMEVKVQLIAESSNLLVEREIPDGKNIYIDKLDLGTLPTLPDQLSFEVPGENGYLCSFFPVYSETDNCIANKTMVYIGPEGLMRYRHCVAGETVNDVCAPQPYLYMVLERMLESLGYTVRKNTIRSNWMSRIFIANAHAATVLAHLLPHWTVDEFLEEVRNFFGVYILVEGKNIDIIGRNEAYTGDRMEVIDIKMVLDARESEINEDEEQKDISASNVAYDYEYDRMLCLPDEVWENAIVKTFPNDTQLAQWSNNTGVDKSKSEYLMVNKEDGNCYAWLKNLQSGAFEFSRVNCMPPLIRENPYDANTRRDIDIKLRIVPIRMTPQLVPHKQEWADELTWRIFYEEERVYIPMMTTSQSTAAIYQDYSINAAINPDSEDTEHEVTEKLDVIEVGYNPLESWQATFKNKDDETIHCDIRTAFGVSVWKLEDGAYWNIIMPGNNEQLRLTQNMAPSIRKTAMETTYEIDTRCQHMISFLDGGIFPVKAVYNIRGKRYVCKKIEYTINERGLAPLKKGYFHELN